MKTYEVVAELASVGVAVSPDEATPTVLQMRFTETGSRRTETQTQTDIPKSRTQTHIEQRHPAFK